MSEIKICPFCGASASIQSMTFGDSSEESYRVGCADGHALDAWSDSEKDAIALWNERPAPKPEAREEDKARYPEEDPVTGAPYFMEIEHPERGLVPTYGGPFESYTLCERDMDESDKDTVRFTREVFDHDEGCWTDTIEQVNVVAITETRLNKLEDACADLSRLAEKEGQAKRDDDMLCKLLAIGQEESNTIEGVRIRDKIRRIFAEDACAHRHVEPAAPATSGKPEEEKR